MKMQQQSLKPIINTQTCLIGIGNILRSDDGVGAYVCEQIESKELAGITVVVTHQLDIVMVEDLSKFAKVIFIDAAISEKSVSIQHIDSIKNLPQSVSHQVNASMLAKLSRQLFSTQTQFYICAIGALNFDMGNSFSTTTKSNADAAIAILLEWLQPKA